MICTAISLYVAIQLSIALLLGALYLFPKLGIGASQLLKISYFGIGTMLALTFAQGALPHPDFFQPPVKVWSASSLKLPAPIRIAEAIPVISIPVAPRGTYFQMNRALLGLGAISILILLSFVAAMSVEIFRMRKLVRGAFVIRQIGRVRILVSESISVPLSFWLPARAMVILPESILGEKSDSKVSLLHEFQHHRQGDTRWIYALRFFQFFCFANPLVHLWVRKLAEVQEFACDESLIGRKRVSLQAYAGCLVRVAETALSRNERFACATGLTFRGEGKFLKRRIMSMSYGLRKTNTPVAVALGSLMVMALGCAAWASQGVARDRQVTMEQAEAMAKNVDDRFPVVLNDRVLAELNRYLGTPDGRDFIQKSLERMEQYRPMIERKIKEYGVPTELMAIPITESGYQNLVPKNIERSAGIWQFIQTTAWSFTLNVWPPVDERLDPEKETDAAMRYLLSSKVRYGSWDLSILAYNAGEKMVSKGVLKLKTHDAWKLIENGYEGDSNYLAKVMAAVLILKNPEMIR